jgi:diguanylate cyclase (GGDEF)-like protein
VAAAGRLSLGVSGAALLGIAGLALSGLAGRVWQRSVATRSLGWLRFPALGLMISTALVLLLLLPDFRNSPAPAESLLILSSFNILGSTIFGAFLDRENARARREQDALRDAATDPLTGALNRRGFFTRFADAEGRPSHNGSAFLLVDIDHFKRINDTYGHPAGDQVLQIASNRIRSAVRSQDAVMRVGGEEFGVLLTDTDEAEAFLLAERLREDLAKPYVLRDKQELTITASIGGNCWTKGLMCLDIASDMADRALYLAKAQGRNRTIFLD